MNMKLLSNKIEIAFFYRFGNVVVSKLNIITIIVTTLLRLKMAFLKIVTSKGRF